MIDYDQMIEMIERGEEFVITCLGNRYWISQTKEYIVFTSFETKESQCFHNVEDFLANAKVGDKLLSDLKAEIG